MELANLKTQESGVIIKIRGRGVFRKRLIEMGFVRGQEIRVIKNAPLKDPIEYEIMGYAVSLRRSESQLIEVITIEEAKSISVTDFEGVVRDDHLKTKAFEKGKNINTVLIGNPNAGKTTLFNSASGSKERVGNYAGVTVDSKEGTYKYSNYQFNLVDLPGTYSLSAYSPEELYVREYLYTQSPDVIINVVDASNLERNLFLTTQLIDMDCKVVIALNMYDELEASGAKFDYQALAKMIGVPIIPTVSSKGRGIQELFDKVIEVYEDKDPIVRHVHINYGKHLELAFNTITTEIRKNPDIGSRVAPRFLAVKLLEDGEKQLLSLKNAANYDMVVACSTLEKSRLEKEFREDTATIIADARYGFITGALAETLKPGLVDRRKKTDMIDHIVTHKLFGFPIFIFFMWLMFQSTFTIGAYPMGWIESIVGWFSEVMATLLPAGAVKDLIIDGIIGGVGGVIIFLPNIVILFFFISLMEDTGYLARTAFIMDKIMHKIGLHGKSFIPLVMGFGCNVPAIMATRTLENKNDRLLTMLINPFMSCSARLPVYILFIGAFFPDHPGSMLFLIYIIGIILSVLVALLFKHILFKMEDVPFVMELPPYRMPTMRNTVIHMWGKSAQYLRKMGGVILIASILIWALSYYPQTTYYSKNYEILATNIAMDYNKKIDSLSHSSNTELELLTEEKENKLLSLELEKISEKQGRSYIGQMGKFIEPAIRPLGFDWRMGVSLLTGLAAKEIVVGSMGVLYQADSEADEKSETLITKLRAQTYQSGDLTGKKVFTPLVAFGFMLFTLIYFPCVAAVAAIKKESGSWKWAGFVVVYSTLLAWIISFLVYQIGSLFINNT